MNNVQDTMNDIAVTVARMVELEVQRAIIETDWDETPILDVKVVHPPPLGMERGSLLPDVEVERYESDPPKINECGVDGKRTELYRLTEPLLDRVTEKYGVGEWLMA